MDRLAFMHVIPWVAWLARLAFPDASASPAPDATFWFLDGDLPRGQFGQALAGGDVNGDGFADVVVGARLYHRDSSETWHAGRALLFPGSPEGPAPSPAWFVDGTHREERFGEAVAHVGDVNGDGFGDVLIGAWNHEWKRGGLWLYYGSASGLRTNADWYVQGHVDYLCLGYAVAGAGDVNGDGFADIVVGAIVKWDFNRKPPLVYAYYGSPKGPRRHPDWSYTETNVTRLGWSVAGAGDVNGDGFDDILVGDSGSLRSSPRALVFHGGRHGLRAQPSWGVTNPLVSSYFGGAVAGAGDVNGDGFADVLIAAREGGLTLAGAGEVFLYLGSAGGLGSAPAWLAKGTFPAALLGTSLAGAGDVNGDGCDDVIIAATHFGGDGTNFVRSYVFLGSPDGLATNIHWMAECPQDRGTAPAVTVAGAGDVNRDGYSDVLFAAWQHKNQARQEGRVFIYPGSAQGLPASTWRPDLPGLPVAWRPAPFSVARSPVPWFAGLGAGSAAVVLALVVRHLSTRRLRSKLRRLQAAHALEVERGRIARDMHDHLGASLTRITLLSELVRREAHSPLQAQARAGELSESARQLARTLDEIVWTVNPQKDTLDHLLSYLSAHAEEFLTATNIHCRLDFPANPPAIRLPAEMRHNLFLVAKEALNNVVKHSGATEVWLRLSIEDSILILTVKDNGRGFGPDDVSAERNGLSNMRRRVETLGGEFTVSSRTGAGTTISARVRID